MFGMRSGASGLKAYGEAMGVVGANISNVNTIGYKSNRVNFQDMLATSVMGTATKIGKGVTIGSIQPDFNVGNLESSTQTTDVALEGDGFFTVRDQFGKFYYTRAGNFEFDKDGVLVTANGEKVLVRDVDPLTGNTTGLAKVATLIGLPDPPKPTGDGTNNTGIQVVANLNADAPVPRVAFDPTNVQAEMYNFSSSVTVVDENGGEHVVDIVFRKIPDGAPQVDINTGQAIPGTAEQNRWQWYLVVNGADVGGVPNRQVSLWGGFLKFTENGRLRESTNGSFVAAGPAQVGPDGQLIPPGPPVLIETSLAAGMGQPQAFNVPFTDTPQIIGINFGLGSNPLDPNDRRTGLEGLTQFASEFNIAKMSADGQKAGRLENFDITKDGVITGFFDNGTIKPLYSLYLTRFINNPGLVRAGDNRFTESRASGAPIRGNANRAGFGAVASRNLEKSNVDLASEFVRMIETQRAFQANAKIVTTGDEMMADVVAMKR